jgi:ABC-type uncharacterized transport system auxiliary subunit
MKTTRIARWLVLLHIAWIVCGCSISTNPSKPIYYYTLDYQNLSSDEPSSLPVVIRINRFSVSPPFDSQKIIYADKGLHRNAYTHHRWISPPGELMAYLIARDLKASKHFRTVLTPDSALGATHIIEGWIEKFLEEDTDEVWTASLCLHITLLHAENTDPVKRIIFQNTYRAKTNATAKTPGALAEAMSGSVAQISETLLKDIHNALSDSLVSAP